MMPHRTTLSLLATGLLVATVSAQAADPAAKIDVGLDDLEAHYPVFVRMAEQVFRRGGDYDAFCASNKHTARSVLRAATTTALRTMATASWTAVQDRVAALEQTGAVERVRRFWIVNGFACDATGAACASMAALPEVAFVFHQSGGKLQHVDKGRGPKWQKKGAADMDRALALWREDPEFDVEGSLVPGNIEKTGTQRAWAQGALGQGIVIALCDSGVLIAPPLVRALWRNEDEQHDGTDDDGNGFVDDLFGYDFVGDTPYAVGDEPRSAGTMVAGVLIGRPRGHPAELSGLAPQSRLMMLRDTGSLRALEYAISEGADVFVMSYKFGKRPLGNWASVFRTAFEHMAACGVVPVGGAVGAAKAAHEKVRKLILPGDIPCVISTASAARSGRVQGATTAQPDWSKVVFCETVPPVHKPDIAGLYGGYPVWQYAPGVPHHRGQDPVDLVLGPGNDKLAAAHTGAVAALMLSVNPELTPWRIAALMKRTTRRANKRGPLGAGVVQADRAVAAAKTAKIGER